MVLDVIALLAVPGLGEALLTVAAIVVRKRWINSDGCILEWDYQHGAVEKFSPNGRQHQGEYDAVTGTQTKPGDPTRSVKK